MTAFCLNDVHLFLGPCSLNLQTSPAAKLNQAQFGSLAFTDQKNGVRGKAIGQASTGDNFVCTVKALMPCVLYLWSHGSPPYYTPFMGFEHICPSYPISVLTQYLGPDLGFVPSASEVSP